jgi:hypothetical protein
VSLQVRYEAGVSADYEDITDRVRTHQLDVVQGAEEGKVPISTITIDDPDGDYEIKGYRRIAIYETAGTAGVDQLSYNGFIVDRKIIRGPYRTGAGRQWVCSVVDTNCLLEFRLMTGEDANRPAETDIERLDWLLAESEMNRIPNHDYYSTTDPVNMSKSDYRGMRAVDVINDCAQQSGKNYFAFCTDDTPSPIPDAPGKTTFWYDWADSAAYTSALKLSNVIADVVAEPGVCFWFHLDADLTRDPARVYSGVYGQGDGFEVYEEDLDISNEFTRRDTNMPMETVKTEAQGTARALRQLADMDTEEDRITCSVILPAAQLNEIREGQRIQFKASHFPTEYREFGWQRILERKWKQLTEELYLLTLTLGTGPSDPAPIVPPDDCFADIWEDVAISNPPTVVPELASDTFTIEAGRLWELSINMATNTGGRVRVDCTGPVPTQPMNEGVIGTGWSSYIPESASDATLTGCRVSIFPDSGQTMVTDGTDAGEICYIEDS